MPRSVWVSDGLPDRTPVNRSYRISTPTPFTQYRLSVFSIPLPIPSKNSFTISKFIYQLRLNLQTSSLR